MPAGVLELHRGIFDSCRRILRRLLSTCDRRRLCLAMDVDNGQSRTCDTRDFLLGSFFYEHGGACFLL